jgi:hypothetical protein
MSLDDRLQFLSGQWSEVMHEANSGIQLGVARQALLQTGHANPHKPDVATIIEVAELFETGCFEALGFVDDDQLWPLRWSQLDDQWIAVPRRASCQTKDGTLQVVDVAFDSSRGVDHSRCVEHRPPGSTVGSWQGAVAMRRRPQDALELVPMGILASRHSLANAGHAVAQSSAVHPWKRYGYAQSSHDPRDLRFPG